MKNCVIPFYSEKKFIRNQSISIAEERRSFLLGDVSIGIEGNTICRIISRIMEKRVARNFWRTAPHGKRHGNAVRYETRHHISNHFKNIFGEVPKGFRAAI